MPPAVPFPAGAGTGAGAGFGFAAAAAFGAGGGSLAAVLFFAAAAANFGGGDGGAGEGAGEVFAPRLQGWFQEGVGSGRRVCVCWRGGARKHRHTRWCARTRAPRPRACCPRSTPAAGSALHPSSSRTPARGAERFARVSAGARRGPTTCRASRSSLAPPVKQQWRVPSARCPRTELCKRHHGRTRVAQRREHPPRALLREGRERCQPLLAALRRERGPAGSVRVGTGR